LYIRWILIKKALSTPFKSDNSNWETVEMDTINFLASADLWFRIMTLVIFVAGILAIGYGVREWLRSRDSEGILAGLMTGIVFTFAGFCFFMLDISGRLS